MSLRRQTSRGSLKDLKTSMKTQLNGTLGLPLPGVEVVLFMHYLSSNNPLLALHFRIEGGDTGISLMPTGFQGPGVVTFGNSAPMALSQIRGYVPNYSKQLKVGRLPFAITSEALGSIILGMQQKCLPGNMYVSGTSGLALPDACAIWVRLVLRDIEGYLVDDIRTSYATTGALEYALATRGKN